MESKTRSKNENAWQLETQQASSKTLMSSENNKTIHIITHPSCYSCGSLMILLNDGKLCPECGRFAPASEAWLKSHFKYSGVV